MLELRARGRRFYPDSSALVPIGALQQYADS